MKDLTQTAMPDTVATLQNEPTPGSVAAQEPLSGWQALGVVAAFFVVVALLTALSFAGSLRRRGR